MDETQGIESTEIGELEAVAAEDQAKENAAKQAVEDLVPPEFRGKSIEEVARMAQHARREMGRQANELGELRKLADELLKSQLRGATKEQEKPKEVDFFENPQEAIRQAVDGNPRVIAAEHYAVQVAQEQAKARLQQLHPDFVTIVQDPDFVDWVRSSKIRTQLFQQADKHDVDAADELFSTYKQLKAVKQQRQPVSEAETASRKQAMSAASVDAGGSGDTPKKVYRRADLIRLNMTNPAKYASMAAEIERAYREGRVR